MIGRRSLALPASLLVGAILLGVYPGVVMDVQAAPVTAYKCTAFANPGAVVVAPCMAPGATVCDVSAKHPDNVFVAAPVGGVGKAVCRTDTGVATTAFCPVPPGSSSCSGVCPSTTSCIGDIPPPFKGNQATCVANAVQSRGSVTSTCTFYEK